MSEFKSQVIQSALRMGRPMTQAEVAAANSEFIAWADREIADLRVEMEVRVEQIYEKEQKLKQARQIITDLVEYAECNDPGNPHIGRAKGFLSGGEG